MRRLIPVLVMVLLTGAVGVDPPPLVEAAKRADGAALRALVEDGTDVNAVDGDGATALLWTSYWDDVESAALLIRNGARVNAANDLGATPLWAAGFNGSSEMVELLLEAGADPNTALLSGETVLMVAARSGNVDAVERLLAAGADPDPTATRDQTALMWAVGQEHAGVVAALLAHGADVHARSAVWSQLMAIPPHSHPANQRMIPHGGNTALMFAARVGDLESARLLVAAGADVNDKDAWGVSATALAAYADHTEVVEFLLEQGADPNVADPGFTALHAAIMRRNERMVGALLSHGADPNVPLQTWTPTRRSSDDFHFHPAWIGASPLWLAARHSSPAVLALLVGHGADPHFVHHAEYYAGGGGVYAERQTDATNTLMAAVGMGRGGTTWVPAAPAEREAQALEAVRLLVDAGVDVNAVAADGRTAVQAARGALYDSVVEYLLEKGANP